MPRIISAAGIPRALCSLISRGWSGWAGGDGGERGGGRGEEGISPEI